MSKKIEIGDNLGIVLIVFFCLLAVIIAAIFHL